MLTSSPSARSTTTHARRPAVATTRPSRPPRPRPRSTRGCAPTSCARSRSSGSARARSGSRSTLFCFILFYFGVVVVLLACSLGQRDRACGGARARYADDLASRRRLAARDCRAARRGALCGTVRRQDRPRDALAPVHWLDRAHRQHHGGDLLLGAAAHSGAACGVCGRCAVAVDDETLDRLDPSPAPPPPHAHASSPCRVLHPRPGTPWPIPWRAKQREREQRQHTTNHDTARRLTTSSKGAPSCSSVCEWAEPACCRRSPQPAARGSVAGLPLDTSLDGNKNASILLKPGLALQLDPPLHPRAMAGIPFSPKANMKIRPPKQRARAAQ